MKNNRPSDQPYQIVYGVSAVIGGAAYLYIFILSLYIVTYLCFFVPLSYQRQDQLYEIWQISIWVLWSIAFFSSIFLIAFRFSFDRNIPWLSWVSYLGCLSVWGIVIALNFLGLYPINAFVPTIIIATVLAYFVLNDLYFICLRYKHYLSRAITFAQNGSVVLALITSANFVGIFGNVTRSVLSPDRQISLVLIISILELIGLSTITYFASNLDLNDPRSSQFKTTISVAICFALVAANYFTDGFLTFWWLGLGALSSSVFYTAHSPTQRKSSGISIALYCGISLAVFLDSITFKPTTNEFWILFKDFLIPILGVLVAVVAGGGSLIKTIFPNLRSQKISKIDVKEASKEFIEVDGMSTETIDQILKIAILSKDFDFCDSLVNQNRLFSSKELQEYFEICYTCAKFAFQGKVKVNVIMINDNNEYINKELTITKNDEFINYINNRFPTYINEHNIWYGYLTKGYITEYVGEKTLNKARPNNLYTRTTTFIKNAFIILLVFLIFSSQVLGPLMNVIPSLIGEVAVWNNSRKNEVRLILTSAIQPYKFEDPDIQKYYAISMWYWVQNREGYIGEEENGNLYMSTEDMYAHIKYMETIQSLYPDKNDFFFRVSNEIGSYYKGLGDCNTAIKHFDIVLNGSETVNLRDKAIAQSAECYQVHDLPKAIELLQEAYRDLGYIQSRTMLSTIYYEQENYSQVVELLFPISDAVDFMILNMLGESLYYEKRFEESIEILEELINDTSLSNINRKNHIQLILGASYFELNKPFEAADHYYTSFSNQLCPSNLIISDAETDIHILNFKTAIDLVEQQNPSDHRINLWNFVYYIYIEEPEQAFEYFIVHLEESPNYEQEFTKCVIEIIK